MKTRTNPSPKDTNAMHRHLLALAAAAVLAASAPAQLAGGYTIDNSQPTGAGNYNTFVEAAADLVAQGVNGPVVFVVATGVGPYGGFGIGAPIAGASATNSITFVAGVGQAPVVSGPAAGNLQTIKLGTANTANTGPKYITLSGLTVQGAPTGAPIICAGCQYITIDRCTALNCGGGITLTQSPNCVVQDCEVSGCGMTAGTPGLTTYAGGIALTNRADFCLVQRNRVHDCTGNGIFMGGGGSDIAQVRDNVVINNFIWNCPGASTYPGGLSLRRVTNSVVSNNSVSMPAGSANPGLSIGAATGAYNPPVAAAAEVSNNVVRHAGSGPCVGFDVTTAVVPLVFDYNLYEVAGTGPVGRVSATLYPALANWQALAAPSLAGKELNSLAAPAGFLGAADLHITPASAAFNSGSTVAAVLDDIDFQVRPLSGIPDRGADETPAAGLFPSFSASPLSGPAPLTVNFTDNSFSSDPGGITSWAWDFQNDGIDDAFVQNPTFVFNPTGAFSVKLTITDASNPAQTLVRTNYISVSAGLIANFTAAPVSGGAPLLVNFTDTSFSTGVGGVLTWAWDFDNNGIDDAFTQNPSFTYTCPGTYSVRLSVTDSFSPSSTLLRTNLVTVANFPFDMNTGGGGAGDLTITPVPTSCGSAAGSLTGYTFFSFTTTLPVSTGPIFGIVPDPVSFQSLYSPALVGSLLHFVVAPGFYPDAGPVVFPPGTFTPLAGVSADGVMVFLNAAGSLQYWSNVDRITF